VGTKPLLPLLHLPAAALETPFCLFLLLLLLLLLLALNISLTAIEATVSWKANDGQTSASHQ
jgi:hypothetical protein